MEYFQHWAGKAADGVLHGSLINDIWHGMKDRVRAHSMDMALACPSLPQ